MDFGFHLWQRDSDRNRHLKGIGLIGCLIGIFVLHGLSFFILYRERVAGHWHVSDFLTFYVPSLLAFAAYAYLLSLTGICIDASPRKRAVIVFIMAFVLAVISTLGSVIIPFNIYGT